MEPLLNLDSGKISRIAVFLEVDELIGSGHFAQVYKGYDGRSKTDIAIKLYLGSDEKTKEIANKESQILQKLQALRTHYFPVQKGVRTQKIENRNHPLIVMELCQVKLDDDKKGKVVSLYDIIPNKKKSMEPRFYVEEFWKESNLLQFIISLCDAVHLLHTKSIIHRDIKPTNILIKKPIGESFIQPFFIDFNTSMRSGSQLSTGGTDSYLPPEVLLKKRTEPKEDDDLFAIAKVVAEILYGIGTDLKKENEYHPLIESDIPSELPKIISKALSLKPEERYRDAKEFFDAVEECITENRQIHEPEEDDTSEVGTGEIAYIRENKNRILIDILKVLGGDNLITVRKEVKDKVSFIFSSLSQGSTKSYNLQNEILQLRSDALPVIVSESYKLIDGSTDFDEISKALVELAKNDLKLAKKTINYYCVSSDYNVRKLCRRLCEGISYFPTNLIDSIVDNDSLYLPEERVDIADLCIRHSRDTSSMMSLNKYMCREYIIDKQRYYELKKRIASRLSELNFGDKAGLIVDDTRMKIWEEIKEYEQHAASVKDKIDKGLLELLADAFSYLGEEAFDYMKNKGLPISCDGENGKIYGRLRIASAFVGKLALRFEPARKWLFDRLSKRNLSSPIPIKDLYYAALRLKRVWDDDEKEIMSDAGEFLGIRQPDTDLDVHLLLKKYLAQGIAGDRIKLRELGEATIDAVEEIMYRQNDPSANKKILSLLDSFHDRFRYRTVNTLLNFWDNFSSAHYELATYVLTEYAIPTKKLVDESIENLQKDISDPRKKEMATSSIQKILKKKTN